MKLASLDDLYVAELRNLFSAEHQLLKSLPELAKTAFHTQLGKAFADRLAQTQVHVERLEKIFQRLKISATGKKCKAMEELLEESNEVMAADANPKVRDAALIVTAQRMEHYEKVGYGCVCGFARLLGYNQDADFLQKTLDEVGEVNKALIHLAVTKINIQAVTPVPGH